MSFLRKIVSYSGTVWMIYQMMSEKALKRIVILVSALMFAVLYFSSESLPKDKFIPSLVTSAFSYLIYLFGSRLFNKRTAFTAFLLFAFSPSILNIGNFFSFTLGAVMFYTLAAFCIIWLIDNPSVKKMIISGVIIAVIPAFAQVSKVENIDLPENYFFKEPLAFHFILLTAIWLIFSAAQRYFQDHGLKEFSAKNIGSFAATHNKTLIVLALTVIFPLLNPNSYIYALPIIFFLVPYALFNALNQCFDFMPDISFNGLKTMLSSYTAIFKIYLIVAGLIVWYILSSLLQYPNFSSYTNILKDLIP